MEQYEDDDDGSGTLISGQWVRKRGYVSEFDIDARWILYFPNDDKPQGSLRVVSHPDLPPGHLKSYVSIVTKRWPKTDAEISKTLENYGLLDSVDLFYHNGKFFKNKVDETYYLYNRVFYKKREYKKPQDGTNRIIVSYTEPIKETVVYTDAATQKCQVNNEEHLVVKFSNQLTDKELKEMFKSVSNELESYNVYEHVETWDSENMDKMRNLESLYKIKIFE